jgi:hypothetical protein
MTKSICILAIAVLLASPIFNIDALASDNVASNTIAQKEPLVSKDQATDVSIKKDIAAKIQKAWQPSNQFVENSVSVTFKLTKDGYAYDLHLIKGFSDPSLITSIYAAVLSAMPYKAPAQMQPGAVLVICSASQVNAARNVDVRISELVVNNSETPESILKDAPNRDKSVKKDSRLHTSMYTRLNYLTDCLFRFPDSPELQSAIETCFFDFGLNAKSAHDWLSYSRNLLPYKVVIMRNPGSQAINSFNSAIASCFQAWRLQPNQSTLSELIDLYTKKASYETLAVSKADPLLLGTAAILCEQYNVGQHLYKKAQKSGNASAKILLDRMTNTAPDVMAQPISTISIAPALQPVGQGNDWEKLIWWFPSDVETLITVKGPFTLEASRDPRMPPDYSSVTMLKTFRAMAASVSQLKNPVKELSEAKIAVAMRAGRAFRSPAGIGGGTQQGANIVVFDPASKNLSVDIIKRLREVSVYQEVINGVDVLCYQGASPPMHIMSNTDPVYICSPIEGTLISSTSRQFLKEMLGRLSVQAPERAVRSDLPEWKYIDTSSDFWVIRHYDKGHMPFDRSAVVAKANEPGSKLDDGSTMLDKDPIGLTMNGDSDGKICLRFLSATKSSLEQKEKYWQSALKPGNGLMPSAGLFGGKVPGPESNLKFTLEDQLFTIEGQTNPQSTLALGLLVMEALGYMVNI